MPAPPNRNRGRSDVGGAGGGEAYNAGGTGGTGGGGQGGGCGQGGGGSGADGGTWTRVGDSRGRAQSHGPQGFGRYVRSVDRLSDWELANKSFCHLFQRGNCTYRVCSKLHGYPSAADVADQAAIRLGGAAQRREDPRASAGPTRRESSVPPRGIADIGSRNGIDHPNALQRGDGLTAHIAETWHPDGLFSPALLGPATAVANSLNNCVVLQHPEALFSGCIGNIRQEKPVSNRDKFNERNPSSVFLAIKKNGARLIGGGIECGLQPAADGAVSKYSGLRPGVLDARGDDWDCGDVRGHYTPRPEDYRSIGCKHYYFKANWCLKKGPSGEQQAKTSHVRNMLFQVATSLAEGRDMHVHCIPLLIIPFPGGLIVFIVDAQCTSPHVVVGDL